MRNKANENNSMFKATISNIIVAFIYVIIIVAIITLVFGNTISSAISLINIVSIDTSKQILSDVKIDLEHNTLESYPAYGAKYANIKIETLGVDLPLYYGDTLSIIKNGVGQTSGGYFPGEGGSVICMAHNTAGFLRDLTDIKLGDKIEIDAVYGKYTYTVYDTKVVPQEDLDAVPIQREKEILMLYTCYPVNSIGHAKHRFVVYANLDEA